MPILLVLAAVAVLAAIDYGCLRTGFDEKVLGPSEHEKEHHHQH